MTNPQRRLRHGQRPNEQLEWSDTASQSQAVPSELASLKKLALAATPGPWAYQEDSDAYTHIVRPVASPGWIIASATQTSKPEGEANGRWIAAANPATILKLIEQVESLPHSAATGKVPEGWKLVPNQMTDEMWSAWEAISNVLDNSDKVAIWTAMLAASPAAPLAGNAEQRETFEAWIKTRAGYPFAGAFTNLMWDAWQAAPVVKVKESPESMANSNTRFAIDGAIMFGREGVNKPPSEDHWLYEYWSIGQQLAKLGETSGWDNVTPVSAPLAAAVPAEEASDVQRDADRYRWLRNQQSWGNVVYEAIGYGGGEDFDKAIDAAMGFTPEEISPALHNDEALRKTEGYRLGHMEGVARKQVDILEIANERRAVEQVRNALRLAMDICDAVPNRAHMLPEGEPLRHLGMLVNYQEETGAHGYAVIRDAKAAFEQAVATIPKGAARSWNGTTYHNIEEIYHRFEDGEALHMWLDDQKVPRADDDGKVFSLVGRVARLSTPTAQGTAPSIDTPELEVLMAERDRALFEGTIEDYAKAKANLIAYINRHIAAQAPAGRDAVLEEAAKACEGEQVESTGTDGDTGYNTAIQHCAAAIRVLKSHAAEQASGGAK